MKIQPYVQKLNSSPSYKEFIGKYPDSFLIAGFFVLDLESKQNVHQIDYYIPSQKKIAAFTLDNKVNFQIMEMMSNKIVPEKLDIKTNVDLDALEGILEDEMKNRNITEEIKKIIAVIQNVNGKKVWNLNCVLSGMEILKAHVDDSSKTVLKMERTSLVDIMKKVPGGAGLQQTQAGKMGKPESNEDKMKKLNELEQKIEEEKQKIQKEMSSGAVEAKGKKGKKVSAK